MIIIGVDFHPEFQQSAFLDSESGEFQEERLMHREEAETFYRGVAAPGEKVRVGMESSGHSRWSDRVPDPNDSKRAQVGKAQTIHESEMALFSECIQKCARKRA
jgi:hypothetical protein